MKKKKQDNGMPTNLMLGVAAGAVMSAAGIYYASQNNSNMKRVVKKINKKAQGAMSNVENVIGSITKTF